jgi:IS30 family transposase
MGLSISEIARRLAKHRSTLYRELNRNSESDGYFPKAAQLKTEARAKQTRSSKLETEGVLRDYVIRSLKKGWLNKSQVSNEISQIKFLCMSRNNLSIYLSIKK